MSTAPGSSARRTGRRRWVGLIFGGLAGFLVLLSLVGSPLATALVNRRLASLPEFDGEVRAVRLDWWRGAVAVRGLRIWDRSHREEGDVLRLREADLAISPAVLGRGRLGGRVILTGADVLMVRRPDPEKKPPDRARPVERAWQEALRKAFAWEISSLRVTDSRVRYEDRTGAAAGVMAVENIDLRGRFAPDAAEAQLHAVIAGSGRLTVEVRAAPMADQPTFTARMEIQGLALPALHDYLAAALLMDVAAGQFELYSEVEASRGAYRGYLKPFVRDLDFRALPDPTKSPLKRAAARVGEAFSRLLENERGEVATKVPFAGNFADTDVDLWTTAENLLRNAFVEALRAGMEGEAD